VRHWKLGSLIVAGFGALLFAFSGCGSKPQMGASDEVFHIVDALFTAVTAHDAKLVSDCEARLNDCRERGLLPADAGRYLDAVMAQTRNERWTSAAEDLYAFMHAQRREGDRSVTERRSEPKRKRQ